MIAAGLLQQRDDPANNQFERKSAHGRIWFSTGMLPIGTALLSMKRVSATQGIRL